MDSKDYSAEKLAFISNLNGTSLVDIFTLISIFPMINLLSVLIKIVFLYNFSHNFNHKYFQTGQSFWSSFMIDFIFCIVPLISICTILNNQKTTVQYSLMFSIFLIYKFILKNKSNLKFPESDNDETQKEISFNSVEEKIIRLSLSTSRMWLYLLTCVTILAVDFNVFPRLNAKTENFGVSLMDLGVGFYIVCHAMKIIRNTQNLAENQEIQSSFQNELHNLPHNFFKVLKNSSILLLFGLLRLISVKSTKYVEHVTEYGIHWNFFFTIVAVKVLACPLQVFIRKSAIRSFLIGALIIFYYQYLLINKKLTGYLLSNSHRTGFLNANKEGIFSCFGYLGIYLCAQSIYYQLGKIVFSSKEKSMNFKTGFKCLFVLALNDLFYLGALILSITRVQNVSRRLCNLSFACYIIFASTMLTTFFMAGILLVARIYTPEKIIKDEKTSDLSEHKKMINKLELTFSFAKITDSKFIGLLIFLTSNLMTGLVNLSINTLRIPDYAAFLGLCVYSLVSFVIPFSFYFFNNIVRQKKKTH